MSTALAWLKKHACPPIRYRTVRDLLGERPDAELHAAVRAWPNALGIVTRQDADGTWGGRLHTAAITRPYLCTEACLRRLLDLGWDATDPAVDLALRSPHLLGRPLDEPVATLDPTAAVAGSDLRAALLAEAGRANDLHIRNYAATVAEGLVATFHAWAHGRPLWHHRGRYAVLSHAVVWPTVYHLRLLACAPPAVKERVLSAVELVLAQPPPPGLRIEVNNRLWVPPTAVHAILLAPNHWLRLEGLTLAARAGWLQVSSDLLVKARWFLAQVDRDGHAQLDGKYPHFCSHTHGALEPDWRSQSRRRADWTFRIELLRAAMAAGRC